MSRRPRRNHTPAFKAKVALAPSRAIEPWLSWRSSSTSTPIRSRRGKRSLKVELPMFRPRRRQWSDATHRRREVAARKDWRADAGKRFFRRGAQQSRPVERKAMIDRAHHLDHEAGGGTEHQPGERLLPAPAGVGGRPRAHAAD